MFDAHDSVRNWSYSMPNGSLAPKSGATVGSRPVDAPALARHRCPEQAFRRGSARAVVEGAGANTKPLFVRLVAAIPVDEQFARNSKRWDMPAGPLLAALQEKTAGRILRGDSNFLRDASRPEKLRENERREFQQNTNVQKHFIEYSLR